MSTFERIDPSEYRESPFQAIGKEWMLITVTRPDGAYNAMTASWGGFGHLWNKDVCFSFIRPQRYTFGFSESDGARFTFSFFDKKYRDVLAYFGSKSGRDVDKVAACGLTPVTDASGAVYFDEARMVFSCHKLYADTVKEACFLDRALCAEEYPARDFHTMYICEVDSILRKK